MVNKRPVAKQTQVTKIQPLSDTLTRIYFKSDDSTICNVNNQGAYIKLLFHPDGNTDISQLAPANTQPCGRCASYAQSIYLSTSNTVISVAIGNVV